MNTYNLCKTMIENGKTEGMQDKLDMFLLKNRITKSQYEELTNILNPIPETPPQEIIEEPIDNPEQTPVTIPIEV